MNRTFQIATLFAAQAQLARNPDRSVLLALAAVGTAFCAMALGAALWPSDAAAAIVTDPSAPVVQVQVQAPQRLRCETCGRIEAITRIESTTGAAASYDFSVRLPDGSLRHSTDALPGLWQVGDRMQLLGGGRNWSASGS